MSKKKFMLATSYLYIGAIALYMFALVSDSNTLLYMMGYYNESRYFLYQSITLFYSLVVATYLYTENHLKLTYTLVAAWIFLLFAHYSFEHSFLMTLFFYSAIPVSFLYIAYTYHLSMEMLKLKQLGESFFYLLASFSIIGWIVPLWILSGFVLILSAA